MKQKVRIDFSDFWHPDTLEAKQDNPIYKLLSERFDLEICAQPDFLVFSAFGVDFIRYDCTRIFYTGENKRPNFSLCDWAFGFDFLDHPRYLRWPYYALADRSSLLQPRDIDALMRSKTRFCAFVYSNPDPKMRMKFLEKLSRYKQVDCGGTVRNNIGYRVADKIVFLQNYKFSIAFENDSYPGYTSEKLPDALQGNTVPIYWGNSLIARDFNPAAFVNCHDFRNLDQVVEFIAELDRNDDLYRRYLGAPAFVDNRPSEYLDRERILKRFEEIFSSTSKRTVAKTARGRIAGLLREPRRIRRRRRARRRRSTT